MDVRNKAGAGRTIRRLVCAWTIAGLLAAIGPVLARARDTGPMVLAAASLQPAMEEAARAWVADGRPAPVFSFAASSTLARQVEAGVPADIFLSADRDWIDFLQRRRLVDARSRVDLLGNRLALVAARDDRRQVAIRPGFPLAALLGRGRLAVADTDTVPAGRYARAALVSLKIWGGVSDKLAPAENVRAALAMVERGLTPLGIVYLTDARSSAKVRLLGVFPQSAHPPIRYTMVTLARSRSSQAQAFRRFLMSSHARAIFVRHGFTVLR